MSCVIDWQRPKKRAIGRKPKLKEEIRCCRQCVGAQLVPFDFPPPILNSIKRFCLKTKCINMGHLVYF